MLYKVDMALPIWRALYPIIYDRLLAFASAHNGTERDVIARMVRLQAGDTSCILLVQLDAATIISHCLINLTPTTAFIEQCETRATKDNTFAQECLDYITITLKPTYQQLTHILFSTSRKDYKAFERKYGFTVQQIIMQKEIKSTSITEEKQ